MKFLTKLLSEVSHVVAIPRLLHKPQLLSTATFQSSVFTADDLQVIQTSNPQPLPQPSSLKFGHNFSDHMLIVNWSDNEGWSKPVIKPVEDFRLHPAAKVLHYSCELFEGFKAYRGVDGKIRMFRPEMNMARMQNSAARSNFPAFNTEELIKCISQLISLDSKWCFPAETNTCLYVRPTMIGTEPTLGVQPPNQGILYVLLSPVGAYFAEGQTIPPISLLADPRYVRAWPGGTGDKKLGSNYGPTIWVQRQAAAQGFHQVLWLFGEDHQVTEAGVMNVFVALKSPSSDRYQLITPPLGDGLILPGVTRDSIIQLAKEWDDVDVTERRITMKEVQEAVEAGTLVEFFGSGTAAVVSPVSKISFLGQDIRLPTGGPLSQRFYKTLTDIQYARTTSHPTWVREVC